jgi:hypothetical protein
MNVLELSDGETITVIADGKVLARRRAQRPLAAYLLPRRGAELLAELLDFLAWPLSTTRVDAPWP